VRRTAVVLAATSTSAAAAPEAGSSNSRSSSSSSKQASQDSGNWQQLLLQSLQDPQQLVRITLKSKITTKPEQRVANVSDKAAAAAIDSSSSSSGSLAAAAPAAVAAGTMPFKQLTVRPVMLKGKLLVQMSVLDSRQVCRIVILFVISKDLCISNDEQEHHC
jgi:hypothetical protein